MNSARLDNRKTKTSRRLARYGPLLLWMVLISFASGHEFSAINTGQVFRQLILKIFPHLSEESVAHQVLDDEIALVIKLAFFKFRHVA